MKKEHVEALIEAHEKLIDFYSELLKTMEPKPNFHCPLCEVDERFNKETNPICVACTYAIKEASHCELYWLQDRNITQYAYKTKINQCSQKIAFHQECVDWWENKLASMEYKQIKI
jgi:hypothetical protein